MLRARLRLIEDKDDDQSEEAEMSRFVLEGCWVVVNKMGIQAGRRAAL